MRRTISRLSHSIGMSVVGFRDEWQIIRQTITQQADGGHAGWRRVMFSAPAPVKHPIHADVEYRLGKVMADRIRRRGL